MNELLNEITLKYPDRAVIKNFHSLPDERLMSIVKRVIPTEDDTKAIFVCNTLKRIYKRKKKLPTVGELRLCLAILEKRASLADSVTLGSPKTDSTRIRETYADLEKKARALYGRKGYDRTLCGVADICGKYLEMIGREPYITADEKKRDTAKLGVGASLILVSAKEKETYLSFFTKAREIKLMKGRMKLSDYGLIGALATICDGAELNISDAYGEDCHLSALVNKYVGAHLIFTAPKNTNSLVALAAEYDAKAYALGTVSNQKGIKINERGMVFPLTHFTEMASYTRGVTPSLQAPDFCGLTTPDIAFSENNGRIYASTTVCCDENSFATSMLAALDCSTALVARGIDRRGISALAKYRLPKFDTAEPDMGRALSAILGVYRENIELASPVDMSEVCFGSKCELYYSASSFIPKTLLASTALGGGTSICAMTFKCDGEGFPDFKNYRQVCDRFTELVKRDKILSARPICGTLTDAVDALLGEHEAALNEAAKSLDGVVRGFVFEVKNPKGLFEIGKTK